MDYQELIDAAKAYADRNDFEVSSNLDIFIIMAESRINRKLKVRKQTHRIFTTVFDTVERYSLPNDYSGMRAIKYISNYSGEQTFELTYLPPNEFNRVDDVEYDNPMFYSIEANQIRIYPGASNGKLEILFYRKVPNLNAVNPTNWLLDDNPDIYLSGVIAEIESFVKNYDAAQLWDARMTRSIEELQDSDVGERWAGSTLTIRSE